MIKSKKNEQINIYIIINKSMFIELKNNDIYQYFGDTTFSAFPLLLELINYILFQAFI